MAKLIVAVALADIPAHGFRAGCLIEAEPATIKALCADGQADAHKDAIAYAESQGATAMRSAIELAAEQAKAAADAMRVEIAKLEDLLGKADTEETKAALSREIDGLRTALADLT
jgi:hypothetical protein